MIDQYQQVESRDSARRRILDAAVALFEERGIEATSLQQIASRVGVTKAAIFYYFDSREALICAVVDEFVAEARPAVQRLERVPYEHRQEAALFSLVPFCTQHRPVLSSIFHAPVLPEGPGSHELSALADTVADMLVPVDAGQPGGRGLSPGHMLLFGVIAFCCDARNQSLTAAELHEALWHGLARIDAELGHL